MQQSKTEQEIDQINVDSLLWSQNSFMSEIKVEETPFQIFTVSKCIQNPLILQHIKPDYGSLGQFITNIDISKDLLQHNRKKKLQQQEDYEQKKLRSQFRDKNLDKILVSDQTTDTQKTVASKIMVENLFQKKFGSTVNNFCSQNMKKENQKEGYSNVNQLDQLLKEVMEKPQQGPSLIMKKKDSNIRQHNAKNKTSYLPVDRIQQFTKNDILHFIQQQKMNYPTLKKCQIGELQQSKSKIYDSDLLLVQSIEIDFKKMLLLISQNKLLQIQIVKLSGVVIQDQILCLLIDILIKFAENINNFTVQNISFDCPQRICSKVKELIEKTSIKMISLKQVKLKSKDFCFVCLGVGSKKDFCYLNVEDNYITTIAKKCLDVLLKFNKKLLLNFKGNPIQKQLKERAYYSDRCFQEQQSLE